MARAKTGNPTPYTGRDEAILAGAINQGFIDYAGSAPTGVVVSADVEWAGTTNPQAHRTTKLDGLNLAGVRDALGDSRRAALAAMQAAPYRSFTAKGWHAQLRALTETHRGSEAADRAGLSPSAGTLRRWLATDQTPSKVNQTKIAQAYDAMRNERINEAQGVAAAANRRLAETLSSALRDRYGVEIRLRDITGFVLRD